MPTRTTQLAEWKAKAKALRRHRVEVGQAITHSQALEHIARNHGYKDWNTLCGVLRDTPDGPPVSAGMPVRGHYLGHPFSGNLTHVRETGTDGEAGITVRFSEPVNVIRFAGMTNYRSVVNAVIGRDGTTAERTSDGRPHLILDLPDGSHSNSR